MLWLKKICSSVAYYDNVSCSHICQLIFDFRLTPCHFYSMTKAEEVTSTAISFQRENRNSEANSRLSNFCSGVAYNTSAHILLAKASHSSQEWCQWGEKVILLLGEVLQNTHQWVRMYNPITRTDSNWKLPIIHHFKECTVERISC